MMMPCNKRFTNRFTWSVQGNAKPLLLRTPSQARAVRERSGFVSHSTHRVIVVSKIVIIKRARGPCEKIFVLIFKAYGPNAVRSMRLECQNKYFPYGPKSRLTRASLYTYINKIVYDEMLLE